MKITDVEKYGYELILIFYHFIIFRKLISYKTRRRFDFHAAIN